MKTLRSSVWLALLATPLLWLGCRDSSSSRAGAPGAANFDLVCDATETAKQATLLCVREDTRNGDVKVVDLTKLPRSQGSTATSSRAPGSYKLVCRSADTPERGEFRCVRLDTATGDLLLITLPKVGTIPE